MLSTHNSKLLCVHNAQVVRELKFILFTKIWCHLETNAMKNLHKTNNKERGHVICGICSTKNANGNWGNPNSNLLNLS